MDNLAHEIAECEREWIRADDFVKSYMVSKNFVESVKSMKVQYEAIAEV